MSVNKVSSTDGSLTPIAKNTSNSLSYLSDVDIISPSTGQILQYDGSKWGNGQPAYQINDTAETNLADDDKIPFYDTSASNKRSSTWSNIKAKLKTYFDTLYATISTVSGKQDKTLSAQVEGQSTVEGALGALSNADKATRQLIDDTVGFISYNVLPCTIDYLKANNTTGTWSGNTYTLNNVTFACDVNNDGSVNKITVNNQASARADFRLGDNISGVNYGKSILSGCPSGGSTTTYRLLAIQPSPDAVTLAIDTGSGATLPDTVSYDFYTIIRIQASYSASNLVFKPMIVKPIYADMPYQPYHPSVDSCKYNRSEANILGAKNLNGTRYQSFLSNGITWTVNDDGTVTANGTASSDTLNGSSVGLYFTAPFTAQVKITGGVNNNAHIYPWDATRYSRPYKDSTKTATQDNNQNGSNHVEFYMEEGNDYRLILRVAKNTTVNNVVFKPMLSLASDPDNTYEPYAKTNVQLTTDKAEISAIGDDESGRTTASRQYSAGEYFYKDGQNCRTKTDVSSGATWTLNTNYEVKSIDSALNLSTQYRREINSSDNLNNITQVGYYSITTTPTNAPTGVSYCSLEVTQYANAGSSIMQRIYTAATIYQRRYSGSPASWSDWYKFEGTSGWTAAQTLSEGATSVTFTGLTSTYAYDLYSETADGTPVYVTGYTVSGTSITYNITAITSAQAGSGGTGCKAKLKCLY